MFSLMVGTGMIFGLNGYHFAPFGGLIGALVGWTVGWIIGGVDNRAFADLGLLSGMAGSPNIALNWTCRARIRYPVLFGLLGVVNGVAGSVGEGRVAFGVAGGIAIRFG